MRKKFCVWLERLAVTLRKFDSNERLCHIYTFTGAFQQFLALTFSRCYPIDLVAVYLHFLVCSLTDLFIHSASFLPFFKNSVWNSKIYNKLAYSIILCERAFIQCTRKTYDAFCLQSIKTISKWKRTTKTKPIQIHPEKRC